MKAEVVTVCDTIYIVLECAGSKRAYPAAKWGEITGKEAYDICFDSYTFRTVARVKMIGYKNYPRLQTEALEGYQSCNMTADMFCEDMED